MFEAEEEDSSEEDDINVKMGSYICSKCKKLIIGKKLESLVKPEYQE